MYVYIYIYIYTYAVFLLFYYCPPRRPKHTDIIQSVYTYIVYDFDIWRKQLLAHLF